MLFDYSHLVASKSITNNLNTNNFKHYENKFQKNWIIGISKFIIN